MSQTWSYTYDVFGNLKHVVLPNSDTIDYLVDGQNRRVGKKKNGVLQKQWLYGDQLHPVAELDGAGTLVARFVWASGKNTPDLVITGGVTYRVFTDQLGSPRLLVDAATGAIGGVMRHDAWGVVLQDTVSGLMPFGFAGGLYDAETGLVRFGARDYDATVGRWTSQDSLLIHGVDEINLYVYARNDCVILSLPSTPYHVALVRIDELENRARAELITSDYRVSCADMRLDAALISGQSAEECERRYDQLLQSGADATTQLIKACILARELPTPNLRIANRLAAAYRLAKNHAPPSLVQSAENLLYQAGLPPT